MPVRDDRFEELAAAIMRAITQNRSETDDRRFAVLILQAILQAGFTPLKSIKDLEDVK